MKRFLVTLMLLVLCSAGVSAALQIKEIGTSAQSVGNLSVTLEPYTKELDGTYHFGADFYNLTMAAGFLLTVKNVGDKAIAVSDAEEAVMVLPNGRQRFTWIPPITARMGNRVAASLFSTSATSIRFPVGTSAKDASLMDSVDMSVWADSRFHSGYVIPGAFNVGIVTFRVPEEPGMISVWLPDLIPSESALRFDFEVTNSK